MQIKIEITINYNSLPKEIKNRIERGALESKQAYDYEIGKMILDVGKNRLIFPFECIDGESDSEIERKYESLRADKERIRWVKNLTIN